MLFGATRFEAWRASRRRSRPRSPSPFPLGPQSHSTALEPDRKPLPEPSARWPFATSWASCSPRCRTCGELHNHRLRLGTREADHKMNVSIVLSLELDQLGLDAVGRRLDSIDSGRAR